jgi:hypothetical protein
MKTTPYPQNRRQARLGNELSILQMSRAGVDGDVDGASKKPRVAENEQNENEHVVSMMQMVRGA